MTTAFTTSNSVLETDPCPCGQALAYGRCCGRFHAGESVFRAPTADALMRSRYSAFVLGLRHYLLQTWHPDTRPASIDPDPPDLHWLGLQVRRHIQIDDTHATVEFVARHRQAGRATRLHEVSRFIRENDRWYYIDALPAPPAPPSSSSPPPTK